MKLNVLRADPAGNITLYVLDPIERERRAALAAELMRRLPDMKIDQVGFACSADADTDGRMEMMGGEFCGNATRAYGPFSRDKGYYRRTAGLPPDGDRLRRYGGFIPHQSGTKTSDRADDGIQYPLSYAGYSAKSL